MKRLLACLFFLFSAAAAIAQQKIPPIATQAVYGNSSAPLTTDPACAAGQFWVAPIYGVINQWHMCNNGAVSQIAGGGSGTVQPGSNFRFAAYPSASAAQVVPTTNIQSDSTYSGVYLGGTTPPAGFMAAIAATPATYNPNLGVDVIAAGAIGDNGITDNHDAITRAITIAMLKSPALPLKFPNNGGCYVTSTLTWRGVSMFSETGSEANNLGGNVCLKSKPGQDLWNLPDINDVYISLASKDPIVKGMTWMVDDSVDASASHPYRKPGRTVTDLVTTSGSPSVSSAKILCQGGDVGQNALVTYPDTTTQTAVLSSCNTSQGSTGTIVTLADPGTGAVSTTATITANSNQITVASATGISNGMVAVVGTFPTSSVITVTNVAVNVITLSDYTFSTSCGLAANCVGVSAKFYNALNATETQTGVSLYVTPAYIPVTDTVGNCGLAIDNRDGNTANWQSLNNGIAASISFRDFNMVTTSGAPRNHSGGFFFQGGVGSDYAFTIDNFLINGFVYDFVMAPSNVNPLSATSGLNNDYITIARGKISGTYPLIHYDGNLSRIERIQIAGGNNIQLLCAWTGIDFCPLQWDIEIPEDEQNVRNSGGFRITGAQHYIHNTTILDAGAISVWDASQSICFDCAARGGSSPNWLAMGGIDNRIYFSNDILPTNVIVADDPKLGNYIYGNRAGTVLKGIAPKREMALSKQRFQPAMIRNADFLRGSMANPFPNREDLWLWPQDYVMSNGSSTTLVYDPTVASGNYLQITANGSKITNIASLIPNGELLLVGSVVPAKQGIWGFRVKCPVIASFTVQLFAILPNGSVDHTFSAHTLACSSTNTTPTFTEDFSPYSGDSIQIVFGLAGEVDLAWIGIDPFQDNYNNYTPENVANKDVASGYAGVDASVQLDSAVKVTTQAPGTNNTTPASTAFVQAAVGAAAGVTLFEWIPTGAKTAAQGVLNAANGTTLWSFVMPGSITATKITYQPSTADNTGNLYDIGIYSANGSTLICHLGATAGTTFAPTTNIQTLSFSASCTLSGGTRYLLAYTGNATTAVLFGLGNALLPQSRTAVVTGGTTVGGVLNSSITVPADNYGSTNGFPMITLHN